MTTYGYHDPDGDKLVIGPSNVDGFTRISVVNELEESSTVVIPHEEIASLMLSIARTAEWKAHGETADPLTSGSVGDWQADVVSSLLGVIRKAADDKVRAEEEAETERAAAVLYSVANGNVGTLTARAAFDAEPNIRNKWMGVARAAREHFNETNNLPF